jgi:hypothetical protein
MIIPNDFGNKYVERFFAGLVFNEDLEMHLITSHPDNRYTTAHPTASPGLPCF